jgi:hypothetical protein
MVAPSPAIPKKNRPVKSQYALLSPPFVMVQMINNAMIPVRIGTGAAKWISGENQSNQLPA